MMEKPFPRHNHWIMSGLLCGFLLLANSKDLLSAEEDKSNTAQVEFFETHIRPLLAKHCISCHGPKKQHAELRLDSREAMLKGGESGPTLVVHHPSDSLLIDAVKRESFEMPPEEELPQDQIDLLVTWIKQGAVWPKDDTLSEDKTNFNEHWSFQPIQNPEPPTVKNLAWPKNQIDHFILAKLEQEGLAPSPQADRSSLLRRMKWDLLGLPTSYEEITTFDQDTSPEAIERSIDQYLASPHYGERWGRYWLDLARYADTKGYVFFEKRPLHNAFTYRDYVINSFNADKPYNQFVLEQIAADKLEQTIPHEDNAALGFITVGPYLKNDIHDIIADRIDVVTRGLMGLTVGCARCHDHKFDPVSIEDYYSFYGIFRNSIKPLHLPFRAGDQLAKNLQPKAGEIEKAANNLEAHYLDKYKQVMADMHQRLGEYMTTAQAQLSGPNTELFDVLVDGDDLNPEVIYFWKEFLTDTKNNQSPIMLPWHQLVEIPADNFAQQVPKTLQALSATANPIILQALSKSELNSFEDVVQVYVDTLKSIKQDWNDQQKHNPDQLAFQDANKEQLRQFYFDKSSPLQAPFHAFKILRLFPDRKSQQQVNKLNADLNTIRAKANVQLAQMLVLEDTKTIIEPRVFNRGNPARPGDETERRFLRFFENVSSEPFKNGSGRLELAQAIISPDNPLTARVIVNRVWQQHFGTGLVETASDFGIQSIPPSHPELLDHLATWFIQEGWSLKKLHGHIMQSATYQQQSVSRPEGEQLDPTNRLLWRANRRRLDFESMRDSLLAVTKSLDMTVGGPSINGVTRKANKRRTLYTHIDRQNLPGVFRTFDFPPPDVSSGSRNNTMVPGQTLFLMNHPLVLDSAKQLGEEAKKTQDAPSGIQHLYRTVLHREPTPVEMAEMLAYLKTDQPVESTPQRKLVWEYGYGSFDEKTNQLTSFQKLPHWTGGQYQGGTKLPDAGLGWVYLNSKGGHPGNNMDHVAVIRWTAPETMTVSFTGILKHVEKPGNGVRGRVLIAGKQALGPWSLHQSEVKTELNSITLNPGETIDCVVDIAGNLNSDMFEWSPEIKQLNKNESAFTWNYTTDFHQTNKTIITPWQSLAQVLLLSNEFQFVD